MRSKLSANEDHGIFVRDEKMRRWLEAIVSRSQTRAVGRKLENTLPSDYAMRLFNEQHGRCAVTGLKFSLLRFPNVLVKHPFAPSLHRCRPNRGYISQNVELVCIAANFAMGQWGEEVFYQLAGATARHESWIRQTRSKRLSQLSEDDWKAEQEEHIAAEEFITKALTGVELRDRQRHIARLRHALNHGPSNPKAAVEGAASVH